MNAEKAHRRAVQKEEARKKIARKAYQKKYRMRCAKCRHKAWRHRAVSYGFSLLMQPAIDEQGRRLGSCTKQIEERHDDGVIRFRQCPCDLTPDEVRANAKAGITPKFSGAAMQRTLDAIKVGGENG